MKDSYLIKAPSHVEAIPYYNTFQKMIIHTPMRKFILLILALLLTAGFANYTYAAVTGPGSNRTYYRLVTLSPVTPAANFQVKITLSAGQYTNMKSDGSDLRFYDDAGNNCQYWH